MATENKDTKATRAADDVPKNLADTSVIATMEDAHEAGWFGQRPEGAENALPPEDAAPTPGRAG